MDGLLDPMPIFLTVEQVAQRWSKKFNIGADCNYVLDCYPELTFYEFTLAGKPIKYSRERAVQEHIEHLNEKPQSLSELLEQHSFQDKLPEYEKKYIKVRRDDLLLFETSFKAADLEKIRSLNNALEFISDASLQDTLNELKQRNEAPYDGVLGCPSDSVTENEKERFISIRNRLLDEEGYTQDDIRGLINDCCANTHSFSLIPDRLKQDIRFLNSLWRAAKKDKPKAEAVLNDGVDSKENPNDIAASKLLKLPSRQDSWVDVISDMVTAFYTEFGKLPNESQAWGQLWTNPPAGYVITTGKDKGEDCLSMPGEKPLSKSAFSKRWESYTTNKAQ